MSHEPERRDAANQPIASDEMGPLDEGLRARLGALASSPGGTPPALDDAARSRVIAAVLGAARAERRRRQLQMGAVGTLALAAAVALVWWRSTPEPVVARACESMAPATEVALREGAPASLGARGLVAVEPGGLAHLGERSACATEIVLERGGVVVRADDLGQGELWVRSGDDRVRVTGTLFSVRRSDGELSVGVVEGHVEVHARELTTAVDAGHALTVTGNGVIEATLRAGEEERMRREILGETTVSVAPSEPAVEPVVEPAPEPTIEPTIEPTPVLEPAGHAVPEVIDPEILALQAERAYRAGDRDEARAMFRTAAVHSEAANLRWARLELDAGALAEVDAALAIYRRRHARGHMGAEAANIRFELLRARHDEPGARAAAEALIERYPDSPQAQAARRYLER